MGSMRRARGTRQTVSHVRRIVSVAVIQVNVLNALMENLVTRVTETVHLDAKSVSPLIVVLFIALVVLSVCLIFMEACVCLTAVSVKEVSVLVTIA